jgi:hypothetical protein
MHGEPTPRQSSRRSPKVEERSPYAPTEFADATSEAFATIDVGTTAEYEVYRAKLAKHPKHKENVEQLTKERAILSIYRAIIQRVDSRS